MLRRASAAVTFWAARRRWRRPGFPSPGAQAALRRPPQFRCRRARSRSAACRRTGSARQLRQPATPDRTSPHRRTAGSGSRPALRPASQPARATVPRRAHGTDRSGCADRAGRPLRPIERLGAFTGLWPSAPRKARGGRRSGRRHCPTSCSSAVCSAATVAYSELTTSMLASDPASRRAPQCRWPRSTS